MPKDAFGASADPICVGAATLAHLCMLLPIMLTAVALLVHGSEICLYAALARREFMGRP